jgi:hypothetical protein
VYILWLETGCWVGNFLAAIDSETVLRSGLRCVGDQLEPTTIKVFKRKTRSTI